MHGPSPLFPMLLACVFCGCATAPVMQTRQDTAEHLVAGARSRVSAGPPSYTLRADQADAMPQGSRCIIETTDEDPVRVVTGTVLKVDGTEVVLRNGMIRTLSRDWELTELEPRSQTKGPSPANRVQVEEIPFDDLRLPLNEVLRADVYLNAAQTSWKRQTDTGGWRPANRGAELASTDDE